MLSQWRFYWRHSLNDLWVNGQRTLFALLCIAAGVSAIVSLQTLAAMIGATLTSNLQQNNRGDMQIQTLNANSEDTETRLASAAEAGALIGTNLAFGGQQGMNYTLSEQGLAEIQAWFQRVYPEQARLTYRQPVANFISTFTGSGVGVTLNNPLTNDEVSGVVPIMVDSAVYPFYGEIEVDGRTLDQALQAPNDLVLSTDLASRLNVQVGESLRLSGIETAFTVQLIVPTESEVRNPFQDALAALNGFYLLDLRSLSLFPDIVPQADVVYVELDPALDVTRVEQALLEQFNYLRATTTDDLRRTYQVLTDNINQLVTVMGLVSLLLGSIGIINTMQVIVRRRVQEIAVLKTLGLRANQITELFLVEAFLMGVVGSLAGIVLGWVMVFVIRGVAEGVLGTDLPFVFAPNAVIGGIIVGTLVTTVFGLMPTLSAGMVRPAAVLNPASSNPLPAAGRLRTLAALGLTIVILSLVANAILNNLAQSVLVIVGSFIAAGILYSLLIALIWVVGRAFPSLGIVDIKIALREMLATRSRGATTLLALVVGVFSLSLITLLADSISSVISQTFLSGDNVFIQVGGGESGLDQVETAIAALEGDNRYIVNRSYNLNLEAVRKADGTLEDSDVLKARLRETAFFGNNANTTATPAPDENAPVNTSGRPRDVGETFLRLLSNVVGSVNATPLDSLPELTLLAGRNLTPADAGRRVIVLTTNPTLENAQINVGDTLIFNYSVGGFLGIGAQSRQVEYEVVGIAEQVLQTNFANSTSYAPIDAFPDDLTSGQIRLSASIQEDQIPALRRAISRQTGTFLLETAVINRFILTLLGQFTAFPILVAALGLVVGGVVIANSVALSTLERRREIAIMKSIGMQRERVLAVLLLENGILGFVGGLLGVGMGLLGLLVLLSNAPSGIPIPIGAAFVLMLMCVGIALVAALTTAWGAAGEKPLNVLRYE